MNLRPGGKFRKMRDTSWTDLNGEIHTQKLSETIWIEKLPKNSMKKPQIFTHKPKIGSTFLICYNII